MPRKANTVFVTYASPNLATATEIAETARDAGYDVIFDKWSFPPGHDYIEITDKALRSCERIIAVLSPRT